MSLVVSFVCGALLGVLPVEDGVGFTGVWERNVEQSDDARAKMQEAMQQMGRGGGGRPPGGGGGGGRHGGMGGSRGEGGGQRPDLGNIPDELTLELIDGELRVDDGERLRIYYLDGEKHRRETANGMKLETVAALKGNAVFIEEKMERGKLDRKFELSPDGGTMVATLILKFGQMKDPVVIKTVYEKTSE
jgi:hypothetical protein